MAILEFTDSIDAVRAVLQQDEAGESIDDLSGVFSYPTNIEQEAYLGPGANIPTQALALREGYAFSLAALRLQEFVALDRTHFYASASLERTRHREHLDQYQATLLRMYNFKG